VANHIGKQKRHVTSNAYDINKPLGEALAAPHKANKINQIGEKKAGKSQSERKCVMGENKGESPDFLFSLYFLAAQIYARSLASRSHAMFPSFPGIENWGL